MDRRTFIRNAMGFAALAAGGGAVTPALAKSFEDMIADGVIEGQVFHLDAPLVIKGHPRLAIRNCSFLSTDNFDWTGGLKALLYLGESQVGEITDCYFDASKGIRSDGGWPGCCIHLGPDNA